jgi:hypothetical protein
MTKVCKIATTDTHFVLMLTYVIITVNTSGAGKNSVAWEGRKYFYTEGSFGKLFLRNKAVIYTHYK